MGGGVNQGKGGCVAGAVEYFAEFVKERLCSGHYDFRTRNVIAGGGTLKNAQALGSKSRRVRQSRKHGQRHFESFEARQLFTVTPVTLAIFGGAAGINPQNVVVDSAGNLYGVTAATGTGALPKGSVYEYSVKTKKLTTLVKFTGFNGSTPGNIVIDSKGNLFGETAKGGDLSLNSGAGDGLLYEIPAATHKIRTLVEFNESTRPLETIGDAVNLMLDAAGDLYGTTTDGGANGDGYVFEIAAGSTKLKTIFTFTKTTGSNPGALVMDAAGDLFGTIGSIKGAGVDGVYELAAKTRAFSIVAIDPPTFEGDYLVGDLAIDSAGDLFGHDSNSTDPLPGYTPFEIPAGSHEITLGFAGNTGETDAGPFITDAAGNLFESADDVYPIDNQIIEVSAGTLVENTLTTFSSSTDVNQNYASYTPLAADSKGNLYAAVEYGSAAPNENSSGPGKLVEIPGVFVTKSTSPHLAFVLKPVGGSLDQHVVVNVLNSNGKLLTNDDSSVTITIASGPGSFTTASTVTVRAVKGVATFSNLHLDTAGVYQLRVFDGSAIPAWSNQFTVPGEHLQVVQQPQIVTEKSDAIPPIVVNVENAAGKVLTDENGSASISVESTGDYGDLKGTITAQAINGVITFSNVIPDNDTDYILKITYGALSVLTFPIEV